MDVLTDVLRTMRLRGSSVFRCEQGAPWGFATEGSDYATFHVVAEGQCWLRLADTSQALALRSGDLVLLPHGTAHQISDAPDTPTIPFPQGMPGQRFGTLRGGSGPATTILCGRFQIEQRQQHPLLALLPAIILIAGADGHPAPEIAAVLTLLEAETRRPELGQEVLLQRLTDTLFVQVLRAWAAQQPQPGIGWLGALSDPLVGPALAMIHAAPERAWTVPMLAAAVGMSRSSFSARFVALVGEAPLQYLKRWRLQLAATMLHDDDSALLAIAMRVGYASVAAFSKAFKQELGAAPGAYRLLTRTQRAAL